MWTLAAGLGGLAAAVVVWRFALSLTPDVRGRSAASLSKGLRCGAMLVTVVGGTTGAIVAVVALPGRPAVVAFALFAAVTPGLAVIDMVAHRLPFIITGILGAVLVASFGWDAAWSGESAEFARAGWAALLVGALALVWWRVVNGGAGLGDVVLLALIAAFTGWWSWAAVWVAIAAGFAIAAVAAGVTRWRTGTAGAHLPLGPFLLVGCWIAIALESL